MKSDKSYILCNKQKKLLKKYIINEFNRDIIQTFMNSKNGKTFDPHRLLLNLADKLDVRRKDKQIALSNLSIYYTWKNF